MAVEIPVVDRSRFGDRSYRRLIAGVKCLTKFILCHVRIFDYNSGAGDNVNKPQLTGVAWDNVGVHMGYACARRLTDIETEVVAVGLVYAVQYLKGAALEAMQLDDLLYSELSNVNNMAIGKNH